MRYCANEHTNKSIQTDKKGKKISAHFGGQEQAIRGDVMKVNNVDGSRPARWKNMSNNSLLRWTSVWVTCCHGDSKPFFIGVEEAPLCRSWKMNHKQTFAAWKVRGLSKKYLKCDSSRVDVSHLSDIMIDGFTKYHLEQKQVSLSCFNMLNIFLCGNSAGWK